MEEPLERGLARVEEYVERAGGRGYDPYDALRSPLFRLPVLRSSRLVRRGAQQVLRRMPLNLRPLLGIRRAQSAVALAWTAWAHASLARAGRDESRNRAAAVAAVAKIEALQSPGWSGPCWGYEFPWETREGAFPAGLPTVVATGFVTNALSHVWELLGVERARDLCVEATAFVLRDLRRREGPEDTFCWSYSPLRSDCVVNASLKGARLCAQADAVAPAEELRGAALAAARHAVHVQRVDGSWPYAVDDPRSWTDHFHTAYVVDCLDEIGRRLDDEALRAAAQRGYAYYRSELFTADGVPRYYSHSTYPVDATACAQAVLTLCRFEDVHGARAVARWAVAHLQRRDGGFAYRRGRTATNRIEYLRWSTAPMFCALARLALAEAE